jgi:hypothetical protein
VELPGVLAALQGVADDGVLLASRQTAGQSDAAAVLEAGKDVEDLAAIPVDR